MAPKKIDENTATKAPRKRVVKPKVVKPKLKTPTIVKIKIPLKPSRPNGVTPKLTRKLTVQQKFELANEVALAQLSNNASTAEEPAAPQQISQEPNVPNMARGKRRTTAEVKETPAKPKRAKKNITVSEEIKPESNSESASVVQLSNNASTTEEPTTPQQIVQEPNVPNTARGRRKTTSEVKETPTKPKRTKKNSTVNEEVKSGSNSESELFEKKIPKKKLLRKPRTKNVAIVNKDQINEISEQEMKKSKGKPKLIRQRKDPTTALNADLAIKVTGEEATIPQPIPSKVLQNQIPNGVITRSSKRRGSSNKVTVENIPTNDETSNMCCNNIVDENALLNNSKPCAVEARKTSNDSINSCLSWTQDISSTTTCVTVTSNDFVRIDKKLPIVQVVNIKDSEELKKAVSSSSSSSSSSDSSSSSSCSDSDDETGVRDVDLSATSLSVSERRHHDSQLPRDDINVMTEALDWFKGSLRNFSAEMELPHTVPATRTPTDVYVALKYENDALLLSRNLIRILGTSPSQVEFARPAPPRVRPRIDEPRPPPPAPPQPTTEDFTSDRVRYTSFDAGLEDDDALSLFAESITGIDSSRHSAPPASLEEYVPTPVVPPPAPRLYYPTRIDSASRPAPICEIRSADSMSMQNTSHELRNVPEDAEAPSHSEHPARFTRPGGFAPAELRTQPAFYALSTRQVSQVSPRHSVVFRGVCFFNIAGSCRMDPCRFPHVVLDHEEVQRRLATLPNDAMMREFALVRAHLKARHRLAVPFTMECARRGLTRAMLEGTADALAAGDSADATLALESSLLHLNSCDLMEVEDAISRSLCGALLRALADTPNFARFYAVYVQLVALASRRCLIVPHDVVAKILERVVILPCSEAVARSMLVLAELTDPSIFNNNLMSRFKKQLTAVGGTLLEEYHKVVHRAIPPAPPPLLPPAPPAPDSTERYTSPDTTSYDLQKNLQMSPMITRIVDLKRSRTDTTFVPYNPSTPQPKPNQKPYNSWHKSYPQHPLRKPNRVVGMMKPGIRQNHIKFNK